MLRSETARRFLLAVGSAVLGLVVLEFLGLIGVVDYRVLVGPPSGDPFASTNLADRELLNIHPPHSHFSGSGRGGNAAINFNMPYSEMQLYEWDLKYDQHGFRNDQDLNSADIAVIGDSFVENAATPTSQLITSQLGLLEGKVVANLGQYGYGPPQELAVLRRYALPLRPRTVLWLFYEGNDLRDVIRWRNDSRRKPAPAGQPESVMRFVRRSFVYNALSQLYAQWKKFRRPTGKLRSGLVRTSDGKAITEYFLDPAQPLSQSDLSALEETSADLAEAKKLCAAQGARFIFVFVPIKWRAYHEFTQFPQKSDCRDWVPTDLPERLQRALGPVSSEVGFLDLTPYLADAVKRGDPPYYSDDGHWSPAGQRVAAEAIHRYLLSMQVP